MKKVYCSYHNLIGHCTEEDYEDAKWGRNPSGLCRVVFDTFTQAVPFHTLTAIVKDNEEVIEPRVIVDQSATDYANPQ